MGILANNSFFSLAFFGSQSGKGGILPPEASTSATEIDRLLIFILSVTGFFFILISGLALVFVIIYRHRPGISVGRSPHHNLPLELTWVSIPLILVFIIFAYGFAEYMDLVIPPDEAYQINVIGQRWKWQFAYENGYVDENLHVPVDRPVTLIITSQDVIHSLFIPAFRLKRDAVPGRYSKIWFRATTTGEFPIYCAEYCGEGHSKMLSKIVVHPAGEFEKWLVEASSFVRRLPPVEAGKKLYETRGCMQCHSIDGKKLIGPTFLNLFGDEVTLRDKKKVVADENYIRESILEPMAKVVGGFDPVMPTYKGQLSEEEISAITAFLKSLSEKGKSAKDDSAQGAAEKDLSKQKSQNSSAHSSLDKEPSLSRGVDRRE